MHNTASSVSGNNFDLYLEENLKNPDFADQFAEADKA